MLKLLEAVRERLQSHLLCSAGVRRDIGFGCRIMRECSVLSGLTKTIVTGSDGCRTGALVSSRSSLETSFRVIVASSPMLI
jgi:hypothetical protein